MGLFRTYQRSDETEPADAESIEPAPSSNGKKGVPTPRRRDAEQTRMERLHPVLTKKEMRRRDRQASAVAREKQFITVEARPERVLVRNYVDSRWSLTEYTWPVLLIVLVLMMAGPLNAWLSLVSAIAMWAVFALDAITIYWFWRGFKKELHERVPGVPTRGLLSYMMSRMIMLRRFRQPHCAVARHEEY